MARMFRVDTVDSESLNYIPELDNYVGKVLEFNSEAGEQEYGVGLYTPDKSNWWFFDKTWVTEVFEEDIKAEQVHSPKHYNVLEDIEAIQIIAGSMSQEMFKGYCLGNILKYRLRCGAKDDVTQELAKADKYKELFAKYKHMCKGEK